MDRLRFTLQPVSLVILPIGVLLCASFQNMIGAQESEKSIEIEKLLNTPVATPVALLDVSVSGRSVRGNSKLKSKGKKHEIEEIKFKAGDNWLKGLGATLQNISDKPIVWIKIELWIEHPALERPVVAHLTQSFTQRGSVAPLQPGSSVALAMDEQHHDQVIGILRGKNKNIIVDSVYLTIAWVEFADGTAWRLGQLFRRNPSNPTRWSVV